MAKYDFDKEDVRQHLNMHQDIINRMAANSSNCKTWVITLLAALTALQASMEKIMLYGWFVIVIVAMFWYLDAFYLMLERIHRAKEKKFVEILSDDDWEGKIEEYIYHFSTETEECKFCLMFKALFTPSCCIFYVVLIFLCYKFLIGGA